MRGGIVTSSSFSAPRPRIRRKSFRRACTRGTTAGHAIEDRFYPFPGPMRILCVSDQVDPLVYSTRNQGPFRQHRHGSWRRAILPLEYLGFISSMLNCPLLYVEGNHDLGSENTGSPLGPLFDLGLSFGTRNMGFRFGRETVCPSSVFRVPFATTTARTNSPIWRWVCISSPSCLAFFSRG